MPQYLVKPSNRILVGPSRAQEEIIEMEVGANATAAKMIPGRFVIYDAAEGAVKEAGAATDVAIGVIEVRSGKLVTDQHAVGDPVSIIPRHSGAWVVVTLVSGGPAVTVGDPLVCAADGKLTKQVVGAMGAQGSVVAHALTNGDPTSADVTIIAALSSDAEPAAAT